MTNGFSGHIAHRLYRIAALEHENHKINYALRVLPCSAAISTRSLHLKAIRHGFKPGFAMVASPGKDTINLLIRP